MHRCQEVCVRLFAAITLIGRRLLRLLLLLTDFPISGIAFKHISGCNAYYQIVKFCTIGSLWFLRNQTVQISVGAQVG